MINLGDLVRDRITGFEGITVAHYAHLNGCNQFSVQSQILKEGKPVDAVYFDATQLDLVEAGAFQKTVKPTGGPAVEPARPRLIV